MHTSYISLAVFALGAAAAPSFPKPNGAAFAGSFPFFPAGSSSKSDEDSGLSNPVPAYMAAMEAVQSAQSEGYNTPQSTHAAVAKPQPAPAPMANAIPTDSTAIPSAPEEPAAKSSHKVPSSVIAEALSDAMSTMATNAPVTVTPTHHLVMEATSLAVMSTLVSMTSPAPTHRPMHSMGIHEAHMSSSMYDATPSSSATPSPSASMAPASKSGPLGAVTGLVGGLPLVGPLVASLGLRR